MGAGRLAHGWVLAGDPEHPAQLSEVGIPGDKEQWVEVSGGIRQFVAMPPDVEYLLTADIYVNGTVTLAMQPLPGGPIQQVLNVRQGAQRMRLPMTHSGAYDLRNVVVSILTAAGATVRIDHVSLRPTAEVTAEEIVQNANFENGFHEFRDANGSGWVGNAWTHAGQSTPPSGWFDPGGPNSNFWQNVTGGSFGTGVHQTVTLQANQKYLVRANVLVEDNGGARLAIGPTGGADAQQVYVCGPSNTWHGLATLFEGVRVVLAKDQSYFGQLAQLESLQHVTHEVLPAQEVELINGSHPAVYVESGGHGIYVANHVHPFYNLGELSAPSRMFPGRGGQGLGIWLAGRGAERPEHPNDRDVSMELLPFEGSVWQRRFSGELFSGLSYWQGAEIGEHFRGRDGCKANPPWSWPMGKPWFFDPAWSTIEGEYVAGQYTYNPFIDAMQSPAIPGGSITPCP